MSMHKSETLPDISYWLALEISRANPLVDFDLAYKESFELDLLYQLLAIKAKQHWKQHHGVELSSVMINNAFFRAVSILNDRELEFSRSRNTEETFWVKSLLKR